MAYPFPYKDLFIADDDYADSKVHSFGAFANSADFCWYQLVELISQIREDDVMDGEAAKSIEEFAKELRVNFNDRLIKIIRDTDGLEENLKKYIGDVDEADNCLY